MRGGGFKISDITFVWRIACVSCPRPIKYRLVGDINVPRFG